MKAPSNVFISATSGDLASVRKTVTDALLTMGCHPVAQDHFSPDFRTVAKMLEDRIETCQAVIHIVGKRYGAEPDPEKLPPGTPRRSYTQMEYDMARKLGLKTYVFVCPDDFPYDDTGNEEPTELRELQEAHRNSILEGEYLYTPVETRDEVSSSVHKLQLELDELRGTVERGKRGIFIGIAALVAILLLLGGGVFWMMGQSGKQTAALSQIQSQLDKDRLVLASVLARMKELQRVSPDQPADERLATAIQDVAKEQSLPAEQVQGSMDVFAATVEVDPGATPYDKALVALSAGEPEKAVDFAQEEIADAEAGNDQPRIARAYALLGDALYTALRFDDAVAAFQKAATFLDPEKAVEFWAETKFWAASSFQKLGKKDEAQAVLSEIAQNQSPSAEDPRQPGDVTLKAPAATPIGAEFVVDVTGSGNRWDYLTIAPLGAPPETHGNYAYIREDGPVKLSAELTPGDYEVRLVDHKGRVLSSTPVSLTAMDVTLKAPDEVPAGSEFPVEWTGPDGKGDYITVVAKGSDSRRYKAHAYTNRGTPATIRAQDTPGDYEVRYVAAQDSKVLASIPIQVVATPASVGGPAEVMGGNTTKIPWTGPGHQGDYVTIVLPDTPEGKYNKYQYTKNDEDNVVEVRAPEAPGTYQIRYVTGYEGKTIATAPIKINPIVATVSAPAEAVAGAEIEVSWTGPANQSDFITVVTKDTPDGKYGKYFYTQEGKPSDKLLVIETPGDAEIRYNTGENNVVARQTVRVLEAKASFLENPAEVEAESRFQPKWEGPDNPRDFISISKPEEPGNRYLTYVYARNGLTKNELLAPKEPGTYELRYITGQDHHILARQEITVK